MNTKEKFFEISNPAEFLTLALEVFSHQYLQNQVYRRYVDARGVKPEDVTCLEEIPFLPIEFFKSQQVLCGGAPPQVVFTSSGTTGMERSHHLVSDISLYCHSLLNGFSHFYGSPEEVQFLSLTPTPEQNPDSSLVFMIQQLMDQSQSAENGYFLTSYPGLKERLLQRRSPGKKVILIGLAYALLDFAKTNPGDYSPLIVMETGGMKNQRRELIRDELHPLLCRGFGVDTIHSEYGMTEMLSQAYSMGQGLFSPVPWLKIMIRDINDPLAFVGIGKTGGINIIDLANQNSCSFIATQDMGCLREKDQFEVLGRFQSGDIRGCSQMFEG
ncbi:MAG: acyltransferase [Bacteroidales bacterium]|nr:acyltransferase [Bacteroidales bacterium]